MTAQFWNRKLVWGALAEIFVDSYFQAKLFVPNLYQKRNKFFNLIFFPHAKNSQSKVWILPNHALSASEIWQESRSKCDGRLGRIWRIPQVNTEFTINHSECYIKISREDQKKYEFARIVRLHGVYTFLFNKEYWFPGYIDKDGYCERCCRSPLREIDQAAISMPWIYFLFDRNVDCEIPRVGGPIFLTTLHDILSHTVSKILYVIPTEKFKHM